MKSWCLKDSITGQIFKVIMNEEEIKKFLEKYNDIDHCIDCIECDDSPTLLIE